jgi:hypothetical protein
VAAGLVVHSKVGAGLAPFRAVGRDAPPAATVVRNKVGKFVQQSPLYLGPSEGCKLWVQNDLGTVGIGQTSRAAHSGIPLYSEFGRQSFQAEASEGSLAEESEILIFAHWYNLLQ